MDTTGDFSELEPLPTLTGSLVTLRSPVPEDVATRLAVPRDPEEHRMYGGSGEPKTFTREEVEARLARIAGQDRRVVREFVIAALVWPDGQPVDEPMGRFVGSIRLHGISWEERHARLAVGIFDRRFWSHGYGAEAIRLLLRYGFEELGLHRVGLAVLDCNTRAIRCYEKCGFIREGVARETVRLAGVWHDDLLMSMLESEYRAQSWVRELRP